MSVDPTGIRIEEALRSAPAWEPPPGFDLRVARLAAAGAHRPPAVRPFRATLLRTGPLLLAASLCIAILSPLWLRAAPVLTGALHAGMEGLLSHPGEVVLGAVALSTGLAAWYAEERLVLGHARA